MTAQALSSIEAEGWTVGAHRMPSPNCDARPDNEAPELLVIHNISLPPHQFGGDWVCDLFLNQLDASAHPFFETLQGLRVSSHLYIRRDGSVVQFVPFSLRAWHAGASEWRGRTCLNDCSIGIELEGSDLIPFRDAQYDTLVDITAALRARYPISDIVGHSDIAPGRKTDPGPFFDWPRYRARIGV